MFDPELSQRLKVNRVLKVCPSSSNLPENSACEAMLSSASLWFSFLLLTPFLSLADALRFRVCGLKAFQEVVDQSQFYFRDPPSPEFTSNNTDPELLKPCDGNEKLVSCRQSTRVCTKLKVVSTTGEKLVGRMCGMGPLLSNVGHTGCVYYGLGMAQCICRRIDDCNRDDNFTEPYHGGTEGNVGSCIVCGNRTVPTEEDETGNDDWDAYDNALSDPCSDNPTKNPFLSCLKLGPKKFCVHIPKAPGTGKMEKRCWDRIDARNFKHPVTEMCEDKFELGDDPCVCNKEICNETPDPAKTPTTTTKRTTTTTTTTSTTSTTTTSPPRPEPATRGTTAPPPVPTEEVVENRAVGRFFCEGCGFFLILAAVHLLLQC